MENQVENKTTEKRFGMGAVLTTALAVCLLVVSVLMIGKVYSPKTSMNAGDIVKPNENTAYAASYTVEGIYGKVSENGKLFKFVDGNNSLTFDIVIWKDTAGNLSWKHYVAGDVAIEFSAEAEVASVEFRQDGMLVTTFSNGQVKVDGGLLQIKSLTQFDMSKDLEVIVNCGTEVFTYTFGLSQVDCYVATAK